MVSTDCAAFPSPGSQKIKKTALFVGKFCTKTLFWVWVVASIALVIAVSIAKYAVMPNIENYQNDIISRVAAASGMDVSASAIRGGWAGFRPYVELENVVFREPASTLSTRRAAGDEALRLPRLRASISWWSLFVQQFRFGELTLESPELALSRGADGLIYFAGRALNQQKDTEDDSRLLDWLIEQPGLTVHHATLTWQDEMVPGRETLTFTDVGVLVEKGSRGHRIGFVATPPRTLAKQVTLRVAMNVANLDGRWQISGTAYVEASDANFNEFRRHLDLPDALQSGFGNVRAWIEIDSSTVPVAGTSDVLAQFNPIRYIGADINILNARAQLAQELAPLQIARLGGRIEYTAEEGGFTVGSKALEFRTREGVTSSPADFSLTLQFQNDPAKARGEVKANGIDLKVMTALLEYFPIGKDIRNVASRFNMRGMVQQSSFAWTGYPDKLSTYRVKGQLAEFASNADEKIPGVSGFTGTVEGSESGGTFTVASKNITLDVPRMFTEPLHFDVLESRGKWNVTADELGVDVERLKIANNELEGDFSGRYTRFHSTGARAADEKGPGSLDLTGKFSRIKATAVANYLPNGIANAREYVHWAVRDGDITSADFLLKGPLYDFPFHRGTAGHFRIAAKVKGIDLRYVEGWPSVNDINGEVIFENTGLTAKIDKASIFNAPVRDTALSIDDFESVTPMLQIKGIADARAEDTTRFLKESPLLTSVGAFTKFVTLDGPGKLDLELKIPLGSKKGNIARITGKYALSRGRARLAFGPEISGLNGSVAFTESSVKSNALSGAGYGNPVAINIAGGGDAGIGVDFTMRAAIADLKDILPFPMPPQVSGSADFVGRVFAKGGTTEVAIESSLTGVTSTLPMPLAKRADEVRRLRLVFSNTGLATEKIRLSLAGNALPAPSNADDAASRIDGRFQRRFDAEGNAKGLFGGIASVGDMVADISVPEGLWFAGSMPRLDYDAWKIAFDNFYPAQTTPTAGGNTASPIAGFDFKLGGLLAYGRPFKAMTLKGRHGGEDWRMAVESDEASGDFYWRPGAFNDKGYVRARLQRFALIDEASVASVLPQTPASEMQKPAEVPALDIVADKFTFKDRELGKLELRATPQGNDWKIDQLNISNGHAKLVMDGLWQRNADPQTPGTSRTLMNIKLNTSNLNALFDQFGLADYLKGGKAELEGKLSWPGHSYQFNLATLSGNFKVHASDGRFARIEPGAGKLLGLMSLQSLPRRITLDFRDIFSEGLAFNNIDGNVKILNGMMTSEDFEIKGPAAEIRTAGEVVLPTERVNLKTKVKPLLGEGAAIISGALLTPVVGAAVFGVSKLLQGALSYEMSITGTWDNPQVEEIKKNAPPVALPAAPPAAEPAKKTP